MKTDQIKQTQSLGISLLLAVRQSLWEEGEEGSNEESGAASDEEAEPPTAEPASVPLRQAGLLGRRNINLQTEVAQQRPHCRAQGPAPVDQSQVHCGQGLEMKSDRTLSPGDLFLDMLSSM